MNTLRQTAYVYNSITGCFWSYSPGFLLRDIKDLWRVALLTSLLLYTDDDGMDLDFRLDKIREVYLTIQDTIRELGKYI